MSRNSLAILAWSITTALLVSACADRPGAFKAIDLSKVQVKTQPDTQRDTQVKKSPEDEKAALERAALEDMDRRARQIELGLAEERQKQEVSESALPTGRAEGKRVETTSGSSKEGKASSIEANFQLINELVKASRDERSNEVITSLIRGMDFTVILNQNGTLKLTVDSLVSVLDQKHQIQQIALISTTDQNNFISTDHIIKKGKIVELTVPEDIQNSNNVMSGLKFYAGYSQDKKELVVIAAFESDGAGQSGKQVGVGIVFLGFDSFGDQSKGQQREFKMKVVNSSWGSKLLSVKDAQDLLAKEAMERASKEKAQAEHVDNDTKNSSANDPVNDRINEEAANKTSETSRPYINTLESAVSDPYNDRVVEEAANQAAKQKAEASKTYINTLKNAVSDPYNDAKDNGR